MSTLFDRIKADVEKSGYSIRELEKLTGIPSSSIQRYLANDSDNIPISRIEALAKAVGTTAEKWLGWDDDELTEEYVQLYKQLNADQQKMILAQIRGILADK